jgi:hypothetical protein
MQLCVENLASELCVRAGPFSREGSGLSREVSVLSSIGPKPSPIISPLQRNRSVYTQPKDSKSSFILGAITSYLRSRLMTILGDELTGQVLTRECVRVCMSSMLCPHKHTHENALRMCNLSC